jgi:uncharacterized protein (TIGR00725 family)
MADEDQAGPTVTILGSASAQEGSDAFRQAEELGRGLALRGLTLCNGGYGGTMLAAARAASQAHGTTIGMTLEGPQWPEANRWITRERRHRTLTERIMALLETGDAYVVLPGGTGTLAEVGLALELVNKRLLPLKPILFLGQFWMPLLDLLGDEHILRARPPWHEVPGVALTGQVAWTFSPESAAEFLAANLLPGRASGRAPL